MKIMEIKNHKALLNNGKTVDLRQIKMVDADQTGEDAKVEEKAVAKVKREAATVRKVTREGIVPHPNINEPRAQRNRTLSEKALQNLAQRK